MTKAIIENKKLVIQIRKEFDLNDDIDLRGTKITSLPDNLSVVGYLDLRGTQITSLPDNISVGDSLDLRGTQITSLPDNLSVGDYLYLRGTQITKSKVPKHLIKKCVW